LAWLFIHLLFLVGFDNKASVLFQWVYSYLTYRRGARVILGQITRPEASALAPAEAPVGNPATSA
jgi:NADH dehydrogenase